MGVADNKTYKDQYHFSNMYPRSGEDYASINDEDKINSTIKENPYKSNVEIEGKEVVLQPDLSALFKAVGKRHSKGGMDVFLKPDSFIFSDDKTLALGEKDHKLFELKEGGNFNPIKNTPAAVLKRNIDIEHYNTLVNNMNDPYKDDLAKKSSAMMLEKYIQTLGNIAYIQEGKKQFPDGLPSFSQGTAPVYDKTVKDNVAESKQFRKYGGPVTKQWGGPTTPPVFNGVSSPTNPPPSGMKWQLSPMTGKWILIPDTTVQTPSASTGTKQDHSSPWGLWKGDVLPIFKNKFGVSNAADKIGNLDQLATQLGYNGPKDNASFQRWLYNSSPENKAIIDKWHTQYGEPNIGKPDSQRNRFDGKIGIRWQNALNEIARKPSIPPTVNTPAQFQVDVQTPDIGTNLPNPTPNQVIDNPQTWKQVDWQFTPWQKISQAYNWGQFANVKRYMPYRSRFINSEVDPALLNEQQAVGTAKGIANSQLNALTTLSPILRNAQAAASSGQLLDQIPQIGLQVENQNVGIRNQFRQYNNQNVNQANQMNMQNDQNYYTQAVLGRQNFDNMRQFTANNAMNNVLRDVETNQKLAYNELTMNNPAYTFDFRTGNFLRNPNKSIMDVQNRDPEDSWNAMIGQVQNLKRSGLSDQVISALVRGQFFKQAAPYFQGSQSPPPFPYRKGGRYRPK